MNRATLEWYELLGRCLIWVAGIVLLLSAIGAIVIGGSSTTIPILSRTSSSRVSGIAAIAALGGGLTSAGLLAGVGAILRLLVAERLDKLGPAPERFVPGRRRRTRNSFPSPSRRRRERTETRRRERQ